MEKLKRQVSIAYKAKLENNFKHSTVVSDIGDVLNSALNDVEGIISRNPDLATEVSASILISAEFFSLNERYYIQAHLLDIIDNIISVRGTESSVGHDDAGDALLQIVDITIEAKNSFCTYTVNVFFGSYEYV